jgi:L-aminopeptidase/D-esterase-like protein
LTSSSVQTHHSADLPAALTLAQRALAMAASRALVAALTFRFFLTAGFGAAARPLTLAQRARWAAAMRPLAAADIFLRRRRRTTGAAAMESPPEMEASFASNRSILSLIATTLRSCLTVKFCKFVILMR